MTRARPSTKQLQAILVEGRARQKKVARRAESLVAEIRALQAGVAKSFWDIGTILHTIHREKLHRALGYARFEDLVTAQFNFSRSVASKLMTVATSLPKPEATRLGQERAYAIIAYARALSEATDPVELVRADRGIVPGRPLSETPVREILAARPSRPKTLERRAVEAAEKELARRFAARLRGFGVPPGDVVTRGDELVVTWTRRQIERFLRP